SRQMLFCEAHIPCGSAEEENLLTGRSDAGCQEWKNPAKPRSRGKYIEFSPDGIAPAHGDSVHSTRSDSARSGFGLFVLAAGLEEGIEDCLARASRCKKAGVRFVNTPRHAVKIHLWPTPGAVSR